MILYLLICLISDEIEEEYCKFFDAACRFFPILKITEEEKKKVFFQFLLFLVEILFYSILQSEYSRNYKLDAHQNIGMYPVSYNKAK